LIAVVVHHAYHHIISQTLPIHKSNPISQPNRTSELSIIQSWGEDTQTMSVTTTGTTEAAGATVTTATAAADGRRGATAQAVTDTVETKKK
jgi:hypothetical protein